MTQAAKTYAQGLYDLAKEENLDGVILQQLEALNESFSGEPAFLRLLASPQIAKEARCRILDDSFRDKIQLYLLNFLKILTEKGYIHLFPQCCRAYREQYNQDNGILCVHAVTAQPMTQDQRERLAGKLSQVTGKTITLECTVDPACMGGVRLDYDGKRVDGTVQSRLEAIGKLLKNTVL